MSEPTPPDPTPPCRACGTLIAIDTSAPTSYTNERGETLWCHGSHCWRCPKCLELYHGVWTVVDGKAVPL